MERVASTCISLLAQRRGYSAAAAAAMVKHGVGPRAAADEKVLAFSMPKRVMGKKDANTTAAAASPEEKAPWVPDPVTGFYRPAGGAAEVDAADLRAKFLKPRMLAS